MDYEISGKCENIDYIHENSLFIGNYTNEDCSFLNVQKKEFWANAHCLSI